MPSIIYLKKHRNNLKTTLKFLVVSVFLCLTITVNANINSIFQLINTAQYAKAKVAIEKGLSKDSADYRFLFLNAQYYFETENKNYNTDSAYLNIIKAIQQQPDTTDKFYLKNIKFGFSKVHLQQLKKQIIETAYWEAEKENTIDHYNHFLALYDDDDFENLITKHRNDIAFVAAKEKMDFMSFKEFMEKYPAANQAEEARQIYEKLLYENFDKEHTWQSYKKYIDQYPDAVYRKDAFYKYESLLFEAYRKTNDIDSFKQFIIQYPTNSYRDQIENLLFRKVCWDFNTTTLKHFMQTYPYLQLNNHIWEMIYLNETSPDSASAYASFIARFPDFPDMQRYKKDSTLCQRLPVGFDENGKYGFKNKWNDSVLAPPVYDDIQVFSEKLCAVAIRSVLTNKLKYGFINKNFEWVIQPLFDEIEDFKNGLAVVGIGNCPDGSPCSYGIINQLGDTILPIIYHDVHDFRYHLAMVELPTETIGYVNNAGNFVIPPTYTKARNFSENFAAVYRDSVWFFIDTIGHSAFPYHFFACTDFRNGMASFTQDGNTWGLLNNRGIIIKDPICKDPIVFNDSVCTIKVEDKIDKKGKIHYELNDYLIYKDGRMEKIKKVN
jgi:WG containing repeat